MIDQKRIDHIERTINRLFDHAEAFSGHCFRCVKPKYGNSIDAFSGEGSLKVSGRFHVRGNVRLVYTSTDLNTAQWEYCNTARSTGLSIASLLPFTAVSAAVNLNKVLNLSDTKVRRSLKITLVEIRENWNGSPEETVTQLIGQLAYEAGFEAILAPSADGQNLNIIRQNLRPDSSLQIINKSELPAR